MEGNRSFTFYFKPCFSPGSRLWTVSKGWEPGCMQVARVIPDRSGNSENRSLFLSQPVSALCCLLLGRISPANRFLAGLCHLGQTYPNSIFYNKKMEGEQVEYKIQSSSSEVQE